MLVKTIKTALSAVFLGPLPLSGSPSGHILGTFSQTPLRRVCLSHMGGTSAATCLVARKSVEIRKKIALSPERKENEALTGDIPKRGVPLPAPQSQEGHSAQGRKQDRSHLDGRTGALNPGPEGAASAQVFFFWAQSQRSRDIRIQQMAGGWRCRDAA